jgi:hypothetical protein
LCQSIDDCQSKPGAARGAASRSIHPSEWAQHLLERIGWQALPLVLHDDRNTFLMA